MSEQATYEDVKTVSADGVTVERALACTDAGIEGTFTVESRREDPVAVRVVDELPEYFSIDDVAFEPSGAPDTGTITPDRVTVTQTVGDEPVRVRYGIVPSEPVAEVRWSAPAVEAVDPVESTDGELPGVEGSVGPVADLAGLFGADSDDDSPDDAGDPPTATDGSADPSTAGDGTAASDATEAPGDGAVDDVEMTEGDDEATDAAVARHFEVRLDRLTARVEKFGAYASALEPLIDEHGTGETALAGIEDDLAALDRRLTAVREDVESAREDRERAVVNLQDSVGDIDGALDDVEAAVETLETEVGGLDRGLSATEDDLHALEDRVDDHDEAIESTDSEVTDLEDRLGTLETEFADLTETVESIDEELSTLSETVESVTGELEGIHEEVETLHTFRKSLAQISNREE